eukprot:COSAG01_NODE_27942_length_673_cov_0.869338_1_plen_132_part_01
MATAAEWNNWPMPARRCHPCTCRVPALRPPRTQEALLAANLDTQLLVLGVSAVGAAADGPAVGAAVDGALALVQVVRLVIGGLGDHINRKRSLARHVRRPRGVSRTTTRGTAVACMGIPTSPWVRCWYAPMQ